MIIDKNNWNMKFVFINDINKTNELKLNNQKLDHTINYVS